jgi:hypothetical protein
MENFVPNGNNTSDSLPCWEIFCISLPECAVMMKICFPDQTLGFLEQLLKALQLTAPPTLYLANSSGGREVFLHSGPS